MPLATRAERASSVQLLAPYIVAPPEPDAGFDAEDLQHIAWTFSGILAAALALPQSAFGVLTIEPTSFGVMTVELVAKGVLTMGED